MQCAHGLHARKKKKKNLKWIIINIYHLTVEGKKESCMFSLQLKDSSNTGQWTITGSKAKCLHVRLMSSKSSFEDMTASKMKLLSLIFVICLLKLNAATSKIVDLNEDLDIGNVIESDFVLIS